MYRDEITAARSRLESEVKRQRALVAKIDEQLDALNALNEQLHAQALPTARLPEVKREPASLEGIEDLSLSDLVRRAGSVREDAQRLEKEVENLGNLFKVLNDRVQGKASSLLPLSPAPREVPISYLIAEWFGSIWNFSRYTIFFPPIWAVPVIAGPPAAAAMLLFLVLFATIRTRHRLHMLRWGKVAQTTLLREEFGYTNFKNWPIRQATGWDISTVIYTGRGKTSYLRYLTDDGQAYDLTIKGVGYKNGVVLYNLKNPKDALPIERFACSPKPDYQGRWQGGVAGWMWAKITVVVLLLTYLLLALDGRFSFLF